jgi:hypothetical protein
MFTLRMMLLLLLFVKTEASPSLSDIYNVQEEGEIARLPP